MPTYDYVCDACEHTFEKFQSMSSPPVKKCPVCGKNKVRRLIGTGAGLIFKGSGFYITDYRDAGYQEKAKADSGESAAGGDKKPADAKATDNKPSETKAAESKPAASADAGSSATSTPAAKSESKPAASPSRKKSR